MTDFESPQCPHCGASIGALVGGECPFCRVPLVAVAYGIPAAFPSAGTNVVLRAPGPKIIAVIKVVRSHTGLSLKEAKNLVDGARTRPSTIASNLGADQVRTFVDDLRSVGADADAF